MESSQSSSCIERYWQVIKRRWLPGTAVFLSVLTLGIIATSMKKDIYQAEAKLRFKKNNASFALTELGKAISNLSPLVDKSNPIDTEAEIVRSIPLVQKTIDDLQLKNEEGSPLSVNTFLSNLQVSNILSTDVLKIAYEDRDPTKAAQIVNALVENYLENNIKVNREEAVAAKEFLEEQLLQAEQALQDAEALIRRIKEENNLVAPQEEATEIVKNVLQLRQNIAETRAKIANTNSQAEYLRNKLGLSAEQALAATSIGQSPKIRETVERIYQLESKLALESTRFTDNNPEIIDLKNQINSLKNFLQQQTRTVGGSQAQKLYENVRFGSLQQQLTTELIKLEATNVGLRQQLDLLIEVEQNQQQKANNLPRLEQQLRQSERQLASVQSTYELLWKQLQAIILEETQAIDNVRVISRAVVPNNPVSSRSIGYLASVSLAFLSAAGVIYLLEITDRSIKTVEEAKQLFGYPWLGVIPDLNKLKLTSLSVSNSDPIIPKLVVRDYPSLPISESYRMLQSNLKFLSSDKQIKSIVITSSVAREGKSSVAANLATAMAQVGNRVLLVDANMHHPIQHRIWDTHNQEGLSNVIAKQLDPRMASIEVMSNLDLLTSGVVPPPPATLLDSQRMRMLMNYWSERYDFVIVDTPALELSADAPIMGRMADGVLLVVKPGAVERAQANFTKEIIEQSGQNMLGIVFNAVSPKIEPRTYHGQSLEDRQDFEEKTRLLDYSKEELWETISRLARESKKNKLDSYLDPDRLYAAPINKLEEMVVYLKQDLEDLTQLVKEQEEELLVKRQKVKKLQRKVNLATEKERYDLEMQLAQEQEQKRMLDETLVGQRRNLQKRKEALYEYQQVLETRKDGSCT